MTDRAVGTVVDASVFLLLVGVAVLTLLSAPAPASDPAEGRADEVATTLAGSTATVSYGRGDANRTAHGTLAGLLADAAVADAASGSDEAFRAAVANASRSALAGRDWRGQVLVTWRVHGATEPEGTVEVGPRPPTDVDVHVATMTVPSGLPPVGTEARRAASRREYPGVAAVVAGSHPGIESGTRAEDLLATELEAAYESPADAARAVSVGEVTVTVRTWSP